MKKLILLGSIFSFLLFSSCQKDCDCGYLTSATMSVVDTNIIYYGSVDSDCKNEDFTTEITKADYDGYYSSLSSKNGYYMCK